MIPSLTQNNFWFHTTRLTAIAETRATSLAADLTLLPSEEHLDFGNRTRKTHNFGLLTLPRMWQFRCCCSPDRHRRRLGRRLRRRHRQEIECCCRLWILWFHCCCRGPHRNNIPATDNLIDLNNIIGIEGKWDIWQMLWSSITQLPRSP